MSIRHHFLAVLLVILTGALAAAAQAAPSRYTVTALPTGTNPLGINNAGTVVGDIATPDGRRGFVWSSQGGGSFTLLDTLGGADGTATAINASGTVTGYAAIPSGDAHAYRYSRGSLTDLGVFGNANSFGIAINNRGQVAGQYIDPASQFRAFLYTNGASTDLGTLGGSFAYAGGINNRGEVVGVSALDDVTPFLAHAFVYRNGSMTDLGTFGGSYSSASDINDAGQIVGHAWGNGVEHAFLYQNGSMADIGSLGGGRSYATAINEAGLVVGYSEQATADNAAFLYADGVMTDLNALIDPASGWYLYAATGINDSAQIIAYGCRADDCGAVLLDVASTAPEPENWALMLGGLGVVGWMGRRRRASAACRCA